MKHDDFMKTINLKISRDSALEMLPILERKQSELQTQANAIGGEILKIKQCLGLLHPLPPPKPTTHSVIVNAAPQPVEKPSNGIGGVLKDYFEKLEKTPHGRVKKGQSEQVIRNFLQHRNGNGATIKVITSDTGTNYGTVRRVLNNFKNQNLAYEEGGLWKWGKSEFV